MIFNNTNILTNRLDFCTFYEVKIVLDIKINENRLVKDPMNKFGAAKVHILINSISQLSHTMNVAERDVLGHANYFKHFFNLNIAY